MATTFCTQRFRPQVAEAEARLSNILERLGQRIIPNLEVGDFYEDLVNEPTSQGKLEVWEEQIGVRLALRLIDSMIFDFLGRLQERESDATSISPLKAQLSKLSTVEAANSELTATNQKLEAANRKLRQELAALKQLQQNQLAQAEKPAVVKVKDVVRLDEDSAPKPRSSREMETSCPQADGKFASCRVAVRSALVVKDDIRAIEGDHQAPDKASGVKNVASFGSFSVPVGDNDSADPVDSSQKFAQGKKQGHSRKLEENPNLSGNKENNAESSTEEIVFQSRRKRKLSPGITSPSRKLRATGRLFKDRISVGAAPNLAELEGGRCFVPETVPLIDQSGDERSRNLSVPETPEKRKGVEGTALSTTTTTNQITKSPVYYPRSFSRLSNPMKRKMVLGHKKSSSVGSVVSEAKTSDPEEADARVANSCRPIPSMAPEVGPVAAVIHAGRGPVTSVGSEAAAPGGPPLPRQPPAISPQQQKQVDRLTWQDLDADFPRGHLVDFTRGQQEGDAASGEVVDESSSDFESPLLLKRSLPQTLTNAAKAAAALRDSPAEAAIEDFSSSPPLYSGKDDVVLKSAGGKVKLVAKISDSGGEKSKSKTARQRAENRWGIQVEELTASQRKRLNKQKQSRIDGFFKNPPAGPAKGGRRIPVGADEAEVVERVLRESREEFEKEILQRKQRESELGHQASSAATAAGATAAAAAVPFRHVGPTVRKKEERAKLSGFDCPECEQYYYAKLEEGCSEDEVRKLMDRCSKHRALYKPPKTPEKFWNPELVIGDPNSPRNKTQRGQPLRSRAKRRTEARERKKMLLSNQADDRLSQEAEIIDSPALS